MCKDFYILSSEIIYLLKNLKIYQNVSNNSRIFQKFQNTPKIPENLK